MFISSFIGGKIDVWENFVAAIILPIIGLISTWYVAPYNKSIAVICMYITGMLLAYAAACPDYYPEQHPLAYTSTYKPFIITIIWASLISTVICVYELKINKKL